jgi:hypothetical protein
MLSTEGAVGHCSEQHGYGVTALFLSPLLLGLTCLGVVFIFLVVRVLE